MKDRNSQTKKNKPIEQVNRKKETKKYTRKQL